VTDAGWNVERIRKAHDREHFDCGKPELNDFIRRYARQNDELGIGHSFVATRHGDARVLGYYTLRTGAVEVDQLPDTERRRFPRYPIPVIHLARLAVDRSAQGQRLGEFLLVHALRKAHAASLEVAAFAVEVVALDDSARSFYVKYGFSELKDDKHHLYLPTGMLRRLFA
jgi:ribosomal protein S18 acetylase RimI-like enzyme